MRSAPALCLVLSLALVCGRASAEADDERTKQEWIESTEAAKRARQRWTVEAENYNSIVSVVNDPQARNGRALRAKQGQARENYYMATATYSYQELYGRYRLIFRVKTSNNTTTNAVITIGVQMQGGAAKENVDRTLRGTDFQQANQYEEFAVDMLRGDVGFTAYLMQYRGGADVWVDSVTIERTGDITDQDLAGLYGAPQFAAAPLPGGPPKALVVQGLFHEFYRTTEAIERLGIPVHVVPLNTVQGGFKLEGLPADWGEISAYSILVLNDVDPRALTYHGRALVEAWVEQGGLLLVTGGPFALGKGLTQGTLLGDILPVEHTDPWELAPGGRVVTPSARAKGSPRYRGRAGVFWLHAVTPTEDARLVATASRHPLALYREHGRGKVALLTLTPLEGPSQLKPVWQDPRWDEWLAEFVQWLR